LVARRTDGKFGSWHLNIGAGRVVYQDLVKINIACRENKIQQNPEIIKAYSYAKDNNKNIHFLGLVSDGGVHSSLEHLFKLTDIAKEYGISKSFVHCFMDGRDTDPKSGKGFIEQLEAHLATTGGKIASIVGRYYAMDRDKRWERVKIAYDLLVNGTGKQAECMVTAMGESYEAGVTDEFVNPIVHVENGKPVGVIEEGDVVIFFNYRNDRAKELTIVLTQQDMPEAGMKTIPNLQYFTMTPYDATFKGLHILYDKDNVSNTLGEYLAENGKTQLHMAETEKYAHVTFFFNGGREAPFEGEDRILVPSPKVATYDLKPEMSAFEIKDALVDALNKQQHDFIVVNFANGDMVGHTGIYEAIQKAVKTVDACLAETVEAAKANGYEVIIIADHGNADNALNEDGSVNTAHSLNPVPFVYISENKNAKVSDGILADVAPSILKIMGLPQPAEMTGKALID
jgi:phosphoglycerate mutase (EC 5.4.2.1)